MKLPLAHLLSKMKLHINFFFYMSSIKEKIDVLEAASPNKINFTQQYFLLIQIGSENRIW